MRSASRAYNATSFKGHRYSDFQIFKVPADRELDSINDSLVHHNDSKTSCGMVKCLTWLQNKGIKGEYLIVEYRKVWNKVNRDWERDYKNKIQTRVTVHNDNQITIKQ